MLMQCRVDISVAVKYDIDMVAIKRCGLGLNPNVYNIGFFFFSI